MTRIRSGAIVLAGLSLAAVACTDYVGDDLRAGEYPRDNAIAFDAVASVTTTPPVPPEPTDPFELSLGACFDDLADPPLRAFGRGSDVGVVPCTQPHRYEVYALVPTSDAPDEAWPGDAPADERADLACLAAFESFVATPWADSTLDYLHLAPTEERWNAGARDARCAVFDLGLVDLVGSVEASQR